jgi:hypothetical protein
VEELVLILHEAEEDVRETRADLATCHDLLLLSLLLLSLLLFLLLLWLLLLLLGGRCAAISALS